MLKSAEQEAGKSCSSLKSSLQSLMLEIITPYSNYKFELNLQK